MTQRNEYQDSEYLLSQYKDSSNLGDRAQIHNRFSSNPIGWFPWVFTYLNLEPGNEVLECGAGPGWLWRNNLDHIPENCHIIITDFSPGMVEEAKNGLEGFGDLFDFEVADVQDLIFTDNSFDTVIANHMLYHVPRLDKGLAEIKRILKPNGNLIASTVGNGHMQEIRQLVVNLIPELGTVGNFFQPYFSLETGSEKLPPFFSSIERFNYQNQLHITDVDSVVAYIMSSSVIGSLYDSTKLKLLIQKTEEIIAEKGYFQVTTNSGLFRAKV